MPRSREELIDNIMDEDTSFILGRGAGRTANQTIQKLLLVALKDDKIFEETWKQFFPRRRITYA